MFYITAITLSVFEVFMRYVLDAPTAWTSETIMTLCGTAWLLSVGAVTQQRRHITVTAMELIVGEKLWHRMTKIALIISIIAVLGLLWSNWDATLNSFNHLERSGSAFNPPVPSYLKVMLSVACVLYALQLIANMFAPADEHEEEYPFEGANEKEHG
ncbi:TRAP transporter small permease [Terasakiella sp. SH-1]|uniref:TRAP transporter small permease subunit n=1 Tax=Terasakiella sp. SH-1 TaxID=2560057 RepID=UPI00107394D7|nr:TRAP transporter small permease [Terasakiella sp. SH-1]